MVTQKPGWAFAQSGFLILSRSFHQAFSAYWLSLRLSRLPLIAMRNVPVIDYSDARRTIDLIVDKAAEMVVVVPLVACHHPKTSSQPRLRST
jgi:hypothetical protein